MQDKREKKTMWKDGHTTIGSSFIYFWQQFTTNLGKMMSFNNTRNLMNSVRLKFHACTGQQHTFLPQQKYNLKYMVHNA